MQERLKLSRLVAEKYSDLHTTLLATRVPPVQRFSEDSMASLAASFMHMTVFTCDVKQVCIQSETHLERRIYIRAPREMLLPEQAVLYVVKPLYGIPESGPQ